MTTAITLTPIGVVRSTRDVVADDDWDAERASIELTDPRLGADALAGLDAFTHVDVVYVFDRVPEAKIEMGARRPRNNPDWPLVGILAQRGKNRPNRIGLTTCRVLGVEATTVHVGGLDAVDGTPVLDLKPHMREFAARGEIVQPDWASELMRGYWA